MKSPRRFRSRFMNSFVLFLSLVFFLLGVSAWIAGRDTAGVGGLVWGTGVGSLSLVAAVRAARAGLFAADGEVILRGYFRTRRVPWRAIRRFSSDDSGAPIGGEVLRVERLDGKALRFPELWSLRDRVSQIADELNRRLAEVGGESAG